MAPASYRFGLITGAFITAIAILAAAAGPVNHQTVGASPTRSATANDDLAMVQMVLQEARGASALMCEMAAGTMRGNSWWTNREPVNEQVRDVLHWVRRDPTDPAVIPILASAMADADPCVARTSARLLGRMETQAANRRLLDQLQDPSDQVREMAALGLGVAEPDDALDPLIDALTSDPASGVRVMAAWALGEIENPAAVAPLVGVLGSGPPDLRRAAASALGQIESPEAVPALVVALSDADVGVRVQAVVSLGDIEHQDATAPLSQLLLTDEDREVRIAAARALGEIND